MQRFESDEIVILTRIDDVFVSDLPEKDIASLKGRIGGKVRFVEYAEHGLVQVEFQEGDDYHALWIDPSWIERVRS